MADNLRNTPRRLKMIRPNIPESPPERKGKLPISTAAISLNEEGFTTKSYLQTEIVGEYRILKTIGEGNFAKVKLAVHEPTGIEVAIKIIDKTKLSPQNLPKIHREVKAMSKINHPNIVKLFHVMDNNTTLYLVMEYAQRGELYDYLSTNFKISEKESRGMFRQVVSAVHYCHQRNIVHRDLKTENLLLKVENGRMNIRLADFGFCNKYTLDGKLDTFCGSPPYAAPELFKGMKYTGPEVDSWSLGVLLYVMVTGVLPFDGSNLSQLRECVLRGKFKVPFFMSTECESLIKKLLVLDASKRFTLEQIMEHPWINIGYENDKLKPHSEPKISSFGKMQIHKLTTLGYTNKQIYTSLVNQNFSDHIYATYLILGGRIRNLGNNKKLKCNKQECHHSTSINHCNFHDRIAEFFNNLENDTANKQKALRSHRYVNKQRSQPPVLKNEPPTTPQVPQVESPKTKAVPQISDTPKPSAIGNLRMARGAFTPVNRHSIRDSTKLLSERKELKKSDDSNQFVRGNNFRATFHAGQRYAKRLTPDGSTDNERNFFQRLTSRFSKRFNLFSPKRKSEEDNNENKD